MEKYDLTSTISKYLDPHLNVQLLEFASKRSYFNQNDVKQALFDVLSHTYLVDLAADQWKEMHPGKDLPADISKKMQQKKQTVLAERKRLREAAKPLTDILGDHERLMMLRSSKQLTQLHLSNAYGIGREAFDALYPFCKCSFECGDYEKAALFLQYARVLCNLSPEQAESALWGALAAEILFAGVDDSGDTLAGAKHALAALKENIDAKFSAIAVLQQRVWLLHWSLFVYLDFECVDGPDHLSDLLLSDNYQQAMQSSAPHLVRYLAVAVVVNDRRKRYLMPELQSTLRKMKRYYSDPITQFIEAVLENFDFDEAQERLKECEVVVNNDYFLRSIKDHFINNARLLLFKTYCQIHESIDLSTLAQRLGMQEDDAERWVGTFIRNAGMAARIDSTNNTITMGPQSEPVYQQVIEKTRGLASRTWTMASALTQQRRRRPRYQGRE